MPNRSTRRAILATTIVSLGAAACGRRREQGLHASATPLSAPPAPRPLAAASSRLAPAASSESCIPTEDNIEGPFFKPDAPHRAVLADPSTPGTPLTLSGRVLSRKCKPIPGAHVEVWHADHRGAYDNSGFAFRGRMECDEHGAFALQSIVPGRYLNGERYRPAHIHLKIAAQGFRPLTTQLYFEGDPYNVGDPFIRDSLIMSLSDTPWGRAASHDIVLG